MAIEFDQPIVAGTVLVREDIRSQDYAAGSAGWRIAADGNAEFNAVTIRGGTVVGGTALYYNGTPAAGTLVMSISATAGTDPYGNAYTAGVGVYGTADKVTVRSSSGDTAVMRADAPSGIADTPAPGLELKKASGDVTAASLTEFDDTFTRGVYLRTSSPKSVTTSLEGVDYAAVRATGRFYGSDPQIKLRAGDPVDAPGGQVLINGTYFDASGAITTYGAPFTTFTPTVANTGGATWSTRTGWTCQIGMMRFVCIYLVASGPGSGAGIVTVSVPFTVDRSTRQVLTLHGETIGVNGGGAATIRGGECVFFVGGTGGTADRLRIDDRDGDGENNLLGVDIVTNSIITIQGWLREGV